MKVSSRSILPVIEYIMNMFTEPFNSPSDKNYSTISLLLSQFISQQITYEECHKAINKITQDCKPLEKLKTILDVPPQPLPSDSEVDLNFNFSYTDSNTQSKHQPASLSVLSTTKKKFQNWSTIEDDRLICGIIRFGFDNWTTIANFVGNNRTRSQCNQRWTRGLDPHISRDQWTTEESQKLYSLVQIHGEKSWTHIASVMGNRSDIQCRYHFYQMTKRSRGYSFSNDSNNSPIPKISNGPQRLSIPSINMPNYILPTNFPTNYANTKSTTDSISNTGQADCKSIFDPSDNFSRQRLGSMLAPRMSAPILQNMPQIRSSSVTGININLNLPNANMNNNSANMINTNNSINTLSSMNNNSSQVPKLNMINNMNSMTGINSNIMSNNSNLNNLQTNNIMNNSAINRNMNYQSFFPQVQQGPPMPQLNGFPRMNQFNQQPAQPPPQDPFFESGHSTNLENTNNNINSNLANSAFKNTNNNNNNEDNHFEEEDIDTVFQFTSKYSGIDDLIDDNGSWVVDRYKSYDVSREKYENEFIF